MIFLDYLYTLPNATSGLDEILIETAEAVPSLIPLLLLFVFFVVFLGGVGLQTKRIGTADYPIWSVIASLSTFLVALLLSVTEGFINITWLVVVVVITIFSGIWLFLDRKITEV